MPVTLWALAAFLAAAAPVPPQPAPIIDTEKTIAGQPLVLPSGTVRAVATRTALPAGAEIGTHMHLWARYVYVQSGEVRLTLTGSGETRTFRAGEMIVEPIGKWHSGKVLADTVLIAVEQVPTGRCNTVRPPVADRANDC